MELPSATPVSLPTLLLSSTFFVPLLYYLPLKWGFNDHLDKIVEKMPNTISVSFLPPADSGIFNRLIQSTKGSVNTRRLSKAGMTTPRFASSSEAPSPARSPTTYLPQRKGRPEVSDTRDPPVAALVPSSAFGCRWMLLPRMRVEGPQRLCCPVSSVHRGPDF